MKKQNKKKITATQVSLTVRMAVGAYLLYTAYGLIEGLGDLTQKESLLFVLFVIAYTLIGIFLLVNGSVHMYKGEYVGGKADVEDREDIIEETENK